MLGLQIIVGAIVVDAAYTITTLCIIPWFGLWTANGVAQIAVFSSLLFMLLLSYHKACSTHPGEPTPDWEAQMEDVESAPHDFLRPPPTFCQHCQTAKPPRTHHCSLCEKCVLRMDHHCPWINNCVGYYNYKHFVLFLVYTVLSALQALTLLAGRIFFCPVPINSTETIMLSITSFVVVLVSLTVTCLLAHHIQLISKNETTIEFQSRYFSRRRRPHPYDLGVINNLYLVLGPSLLLWFYPTTPTGDGTSYPTIDAADWQGSEMGSRHKSTGQKQRRVHHPLDPDAAHTTHSEHAVTIHV